MINLMIDDQHAALDALRDAAADLERFIDALVPRLRAGGRLIYVGAGTSGRLGVLDASECPPTFNADPGQIVGIIAGGDASLRRSSESREDDPDGAREQLEILALSPRDTVLGIAAGGTTPYVLGALTLAKRLSAGGDAHVTTGGTPAPLTPVPQTPAPLTPDMQTPASTAMTGLLTCVRRAAPQACDHLIVLDTGAELLTGSTRLKAGTATKIALNIITTSCFVHLGKTWGNLMVDLRATNDKLRDRAMRILIELNPRLTRVEAAAALDEARGELKAALVMERLGVDLGTARTLLAEHDGRLRGVLGSPATPANAP